MWVGAICLVTFNNCLFWEWLLCSFCILVLPAQLATVLLKRPLFLLPVFFFFFLQRLAIAAEVLLQASPTTFHYETTAVPWWAKNNRDRQACCNGNLLLESVRMSCPLWRLLHSRAIVRIKIQYLPEVGIVCASLCPLRPIQLILKEFELRD